MNRPFRFDLASDQVHPKVLASGIGAGDYIKGPNGWVEVLDVVRGEESVLFKPDRGDPFTLPARTYVERMRAL